MKRDKIPCLTISKWSVSVRRFFIVRLRISWLFARKTVHSAKQELFRPPAGEITLDWLTCVDIHAQVMGEITLTGDRRNHSHKWRAKPLPGEVTDNQPKKLLAKISYWLWWDMFLSLIPTELGAKTSWQNCCMLHTTGLCQPRERQIWHNKWLKWKKGEDNPLIAKCAPDLHVNSKRGGWSRNMMNIDDTC